MKTRAKLEVGIDEVGRGPLAGPVAVCAFAVFNPKILKQFPKNCDSKHFSIRKREEIYEQIQKEEKEKTIAYAVVYSSPAYIDRHGIEMATRTALVNALKKLSLKPKEVEILLDGRLRAPAEYVYQKTFIKGDVRIQVIGLASIVAKVERDRKMAKMAKTYPHYGFEKNAGYGTQTHIIAIRKYGPTSIHRMSFLKNILDRGRSLAK